MQRCAGMLWSARAWLKLLLLCGPLHERGAAERAMLCGSLPAPGCKQALVGNTAGTYFLAQLTCTPFASLRRLQTELQSALPLKRLCSTLLPAL